MKVGAPPRERSSAGQAMEFRIWAALIGQSYGALHVFLPILDRGLDAVLHRKTDGSFISLQVKGRGELDGRALHLVIPHNKLVDDHALIIGCFLIRDEMGPLCLLIEEGMFKQLASSYVFRGEQLYWVNINLDSPTDAWKRYVVPTAHLARRLMGQRPSPRWNLPKVEEVPPVDDYTSWLGSLGEMEVIRLLAFNPDLWLFRPFPDNELVEVLIRGGVNGRFCGLQVKTAVPSQLHHDEAGIYVRKATFAPAPDVFVVGVVWLPEQRQFSDECVVVPTMELPSIASENEQFFQLHFRPHSPERTRLDPYRRPMEGLGDVVGKIIATA